MVLSMDKWKGKVAVVTGASSGCGAAIVEELVKYGLVVVGMARRLPMLEELAQRLPPNAQFHPLKVDVSSEPQVNAAFKQILDTWGPVAVLVNSAGLAQPTTLCGAEANVDMWRSVLNVNVLGLSIATNQAIAHMVQAANGDEAKADGHIIHINSVLGHYVAMVPQVNMYAASKFAVTALTETLRQELMHKNSGIRVTSVSPGPVDNEFVNNVHEKFQDKFREMPKLKSEDVADAVVYVLSTPPHVQVQEVMLRPLGEPV